MEPRTRWMLGAAALLLVLAYVFPIWMITLEAPQYPEGLGLEIWIDTVKGQKQHDLSNINNLNHYIGMKRIVPETIPELKWMPWIISGLIVLGLGAALSGKKALLYLWVVIFFVTAVVGLIDFYLWEYDYGHNLDQETAIIKIPGMNYQPPLIGPKKLLNFTAHSWPHVGGWAAFVSLSIGMWLIFRSLRPEKKKSRAQKPVLETAVAMMVVLGLSACTPEPQPITYDAAVCTHCQMKITDNRYGAELVTQTSKAYMFDSVECLAAYLQTSGMERPDVHSLWVTDFQEPGRLVSVDSALFLKSLALHSPMGGNLTAFGPPATPAGMQRTFGGEVLSWAEVQRLQLH